MEIGFREIEVTDAKKFLSLRTVLDGETSFMLLEAGERKQDADLEEKKIEEIKKDNFKEIFVLELGGELAGFTAIFGQDLKRVRHRASIVIGILQEYTGKGYGKKLLEKAEDWAVERGIHRLELTVMTHNKNALWLYNTVGFDVEGIRRKAMFVDGIYVDEFYLSKML